MPATNRLTYTEMLSLQSQVGDLEVGERANTFHCKKGNGNDRCYIERKHDCTLFYCFHCGSGGRIRENFSRLKGAKKGSGTTGGAVKSYRPSYPRDADYDPNKWGVKALGWIGKAGITLTEVATHGFSYSPTTERVYIPVYKDGNKVGWTGRRIGEDGPKYLTNLQDDFAYLIANHASDKVVIVEDTLSAIRVGRVANCLALMGTSLSNYAKSKLLGKYHTFIIWLDNDNPIVKRRQIDLRNTLAILGDVYIIKTDKDPKEYTDIEILDHINIP